MDVLSETFSPMMWQGERRFSLNYSNSMSKSFFSKNAQGRLQSEDDSISFLVQQLRAGSISPSDLDQDTRNMILHHCQLQSEYKRRQRRFNCSEVDAVVPKYKSRQNKLAPNVTSHQFSVPEEHLTSSHNSIPERTADVSAGFRFGTRQLVALSTENEQSSLCTYRTELDFLSVPDFARTSFQRPASASDKRPEGDRLSGSRMLAAGLQGPAKFNGGDVAAPSLSRGMTAPQYLPSYLERNDSLDSEILTGFQAVPDFRPSPILSKGSCDLNPLSMPPTVMARQKRIAADVESGKRKRPAVDSAVNNGNRTYVDFNPPSETVKTSESMVEGRRKLRLLKNRESAQQARERKIQQMMDLELYCHDMELKNAEMQTQFIRLQKENQEYRKLLEEGAQGKGGNISRSISSERLLQLQNELRDLIASDCDHYSNRNRENIFGVFDHSSLPINPIKFEIDFTYDEIKNSSYNTNEDTKASNGSGSNSNKDKNNSYMNYNINNSSNTNYGHSNYSPNNIKSNNNNNGEEMGRLQEHTYMRMDTSQSWCVDFLPDRSRYEGDNHSNIIYSQNEQKWRQNLLADSKY